MDKSLYGRILPLLGVVLLLSVITLGVAGLIGANATVWIRGGVVAVITAVLIGLAARARRGSRGAYRRLRVLCTVGPVAVIVIVAWPHLGLPLWMKIEQVVVGALLAAVAVLLTRAARRRSPASVLDQ